MHQPVCVRVSVQPGSPSDGARQALCPPAFIERCVDVAVDQPERYLGSRAPQRSSEWLATLVRDAYRPRIAIRALDDVAAVDPWVTGIPSPRTSIRNDRALHARMLTTRVAAARAT